MTTFTASFIRSRRWLNAVPSAALRSENDANSAVKSFTAASRSLDKPAVFAASAKEENASCKVVKDELTKA